MIAQRSILSVLLTILFSACTKENMGNGFVFDNDLNELHVSMTHMRKQKLNKRLIYSSTSSENKLTVRNAITGGKVQLQISDESGRILFEEQLQRLHDIEVELNAMPGNWMVNISSEHANGSCAIELSSVMKSSLHQ